MIYFHIGLHKTATTWLQQRLFAHHPQIALLADPARPWDCPFLNYLIRTSDRKFAARHASLLLKQLMDEMPTQGEEVARTPLISAERLGGHPGSGGFDTWRLADRIQACAPSCRIILVIRNQLDTIWSMYKQLVWEGFAGPFSSLLEPPGWKTATFSLEYYEYDLLVEAYFERFGRDNVCILLYEDFVDLPESFIADICEFLGVANFTPPGWEVTNRGLPDFALGPMRLLNRFRRTEFFPYPLLAGGDQLHRWILPLFKLRRPSRQRIGGSEGEFLREHYRESNQRLRRLLERPLSEYP